MHPPETVRAAFLRRDRGEAIAAIADELGVSPSCIREWFATGLESLTERRFASELCPKQCRRIDGLPRRAYAYLLGQYLGDGWISRGSTRGVYKLGVACSAEYPSISDECARAISEVMPTNSVGRVSRPGVVFLQSYSKHWPCVIPQHGAGPKHARRIELAAWQRTIALHDHPQSFLRGLIHSDGWRGTNPVVSKTGTRYEYTRYQFSNRSADIRGLFVAACEAVGVECKQMNRYNISVNRRGSVALLDEFVGPKS